ncbi:urocortin-3 [Paramormyrops kingsleyae]|uniref:urocortin-3 n=1 Tax=Paramormyrops kingsleyae TaxID=1676925 RepID=UPI000CD62F8C|nr:urocortin-3 [Paramormyrops kingsleyae]
MLLPLKALVMLAVLCAPTYGLCFRLYDSDSRLLCDNDVLSGTKKGDLSRDSLPDARGFLYLPGYLPSNAESREKRTFPASSYRYLSQTQLRGKMYQNSAKSDRQAKFTLSLDVPTNIMNILFNIAKAKSLRAKAADNARLMAQIGKRK